MNKISSAELLRQFLVEGLTSDREYWVQGDIVTFNYHEWVISIEDNFLSLDYMQNEEDNDDGSVAAGFMFHFESLKSINLQGTRLVVQFLNSTKIELDLTPVEAEIRTCRGHFIPGVYNRSSLFLELLEVPKLGVEHSNIDDKAICFTNCEKGGSNVFILLESDTFRVSSDSNMKEDCTTELKYEDLSSVERLKDSLLFWLKNGCGVSLHLESDCNEV